MVEFGVSLVVLVTPKILHDEFLRRLLDLVSEFDGALLGGETLGSLSPEELVGAYKGLKNRPLANQPKIR